ncbi:unnamed protein product [Miscanthus lutarioriparius]|uniref:Uncharacterized protein n=1 Tax=Miscanthus lutarioriparius TaxID=422564 RepID=A0A811MDM8_9POAL|nr:unnamed protein product [Miscanthus lutarioriparius]
MPPETLATQKRRHQGLVSRVSKVEEHLRRPRGRREAAAGRQSAHNVLVLALATALEIVAAGYAIMTTRSPDISWQMRALRVLPMFLVPARAALIYSTITRLTKIRKASD